MVFMPELGDLEGSIKPEVWRRLREAQAEVADREAAAIQASQMPVTEEQAEGESAPHRTVDGIRSFAVGAAIVGLIIARRHGSDS